MVRSVALLLFVSSSQALHLAAKHGQLACLKTFLNCVLVHGGGNTSTPRCVRAGEEAKVHCPAPGRPSPIPR